MVAFLYWFAASLFVPSLPVYVKTKAEDLALVGGVLSMFGLWSMAIRLPLGIVSDWLGRRKPFIIGALILMGIGATIMGVSNNVPGLMIGRSITGIAGGVWVLLVVTFSSMFPPEDAVRATAILGVVNSTGRVIGSAANGFLNDLGGYSLAFFISSGIAFLAVLIYLPGREQHHKPMNLSIKGARDLISRRDVVLPAVLNALSQYTVWTTTFSFIPILAEKFGATNVMLGSLLSMNVALQLLGNFLVSRIAGRIGSRRLIYISYTLSACSLLVAAFANSLFLIFLAQFLGGLAGGIDYPTLMGMSIQNVGESERSTAMGLHQSILAMGIFIAPWLSGLLANAIDIQPMMGLTAIVYFSLGMFGIRRLSDSRKVTITPAGNTRL
jgi:MFS transporter, DHA1 family, multidrug resistance protein